MGEGKPAKGREQFAADVGAALVGSGPAFFLGKLAEKVGWPRDPLSAFVLFLKTAVTFL